MRKKEVILVCLAVLLSIAVRLILFLPFLSDHLHSIALSIHPSNGNLEGIAFYTLAAATEGFLSVFLLSVFLLFARLASQSGQKPIANHATLLCAVPFLPSVLRALIVVLRGGQSLGLSFGVMNYRSQREAAEDVFSILLPLFIALILVSLLLKRAYRQPPSRSLEEDTPEGVSKEDGLGDKFTAL